MNDHQPTDRPLCLAIAVCLTIAAVALSIMAHLAIPNP
jgi:hypothetical protein